MKALLIRFALLFVLCSHSTAAPMPPNVLLGGGKSLRPVLEDPTRTHKPAAFSLVTRGAQKFGQSVRTARWRFTQWSDGASELYDHDADPEETLDLSRLTENHATITELKTRLRSLPPWPVTK